MIWPHGTGVRCCGPRRPHDDRAFFSRRRRTPRFGTRTLRPALLETAELRVRTGVAVEVGAVARPARPPLGGSPTSQDTPTPVQPAADEVVEIKVPAPAPEPAVEVKKEEPQPAPAKKACCAVC